MTSNTISNTSDVIDVRAVIERFEELQEQRTARFVAGLNMPGYMPDGEPAEFDSFDAAKRYIIEEVKRSEEQAETEEEAEALAAFAEDVNLESSDFSAQCGQYVYWVSEDGVMGLDGEEQEELQSLEALLSNLKGNGGDEQWRGDWYPITLVRDSYFKDYAQELAEDCGMVDYSKLSWPLTCIDWEQAARELRMDHTSVEFDGVTYWYR